MSDFSKRLSDLVEKKYPGHGGQKLAADACKVKQPQLSIWCTGKRMPSDANIEKLAVGLGVTVDYLHYGVEPNYQIERRGSVAAGPFAHLDTESKWITVFEKYPKGCFALSVSGKSCTNFGICDGDTVIVKPTKDVHEGKFMVVQTAEGYTIKGYSGGHLWKWPADGDLEPIPDADGAVVCGYVLKTNGERAFDPKKFSFPKPPNRKGKVA